MLKKNKVQHTKKVNMSRSTRVFSLQYMNELVMGRHVDTSFPLKLTCGWGGIVIFNTHLQAPFLQTINNAISSATAHTSWDLGLNVKTGPRSHKTSLLIRTFFRPASSLRPLSVTAPLSPCLSSAPSLIIIRMKLSKTPLSKTLAAVATDTKNKEKHKKTESRVSFTATCHPLI